MAIPTASGLTTDNLNQATDNPSRSRSDLAVAVQKLRELLESVDKAGGMVKLNTDAQIEIARLLKVGSGLKLQKVSGQGNVLSHTNNPETAADVRAASGEAIKRVKIDASGHVVRVEKGDVASLAGPFYSEWYYSRYDEISRKNLGRRRPSNYNDDVLAWIPGLNKVLPPFDDYFKSLGSDKLLSSLAEEAMANVAGTRFNRVVREQFTPGSGTQTSTTYYELTIKPYRARYVYYTVS